MMPGGSWLKNHDRASSGDDAYPYEFGYVIIKSRVRQYGRATEGRAWFANGSGHSHEKGGSTQSTFSVYVNHNGTHAV